MRANSALSFEPAACWRRLQQSKEFFVEDLEAQMKEYHQKFLEELMLYERQCFINAHPYERAAQRVDQANGFYSRALTTRLGFGFEGAAHPFGPFPSAGIAALSTPGAGHQ